MINLLYTALCIISLCVGFFYGYKIGKGERVQNPVSQAKENITKKVQEHQYEEAVKEEIEKYNTLLDNIENYNGTSEGQKELKNFEIKL